MASFSDGFLGIGTGFAQPLAAVTACFIDAVQDITNSIDQMTVGNDTFALNHR